MGGSAGRSGGGKSGRERWAEVRAGAEGGRVGGSGGRSEDGSGGLRWREHAGSFPEYSDGRVQGVKAIAEDEVWHCTAALPMAMHPFPLQT